MNREDLIMTQKWLNAIKRGGAERKSALTEIYNILDLEDEIRFKITLNKKKQNQHMDLLHESFCVFLEKVKQAQVPLDTNIRGYIFNIARLTWKNKMKKQRYTTDAELSEVMEPVESVETNYLKQELKNKMSSLLSELKEECRKILVLWKTDYSFKEIASLMNIDTENNARKMKYRCYQTLLKSIRDQDQLKSYLYE